MDFCHLHIHTEFSLQDSTIVIPPLIKKVKDGGMKACAITDHANMYGVIKFYKECLKENIKPIIGCEIYTSLSKSDKKPLAHHLVLLARNIEGYKNLLKLLSFTHLNSGNGFPWTPPKKLKEFSEGLIALSGCAGGEIPYSILKKDFEVAKRLIEEYQEIFGMENFYLEVQATEVKEQNIINEEILKLSKKMNVPAVATNDCHYLNREDAKIHQVLMCLQLGKILKSQMIESPKATGFYVKSPEEMASFFKGSKKVIENSIKIAEECNVKLQLGNLRFPNFKVPEGYTTETYLKKLAVEGLEKRIEEMKRRGEEVDEEKYFNRLKYEIDQIINLGYAGYFLIVSDFIKFAINNGILVGPGRGSGAGSLVAFAINITQIDPIRYGLFFERFLNPERRTPPDFDIDFEKIRRDEVLQYVVETYGNENVGQIITFGTLKVRAVVWDVGRVLGFNVEDVRKIAKKIPEGLKVSLKDVLLLEPVLMDMYEKDEKVKALFDYAIKLEGIHRNTSTHAAGIVIADEPLWNYTPLTRGKKGEVTTQYDMNDVSECGLIKFDFLGLKALTVIEGTINLIKSNKNPSFDFNSIPFDDKKTFKLLSAGNTVGIFQLESKPFRELLKQLKPQRIEDLIDAIALYRPGPIGSGMIDLYIKRKHGEEKITYPHPKIEKILKDTYGVIIYQEQVMEIASHLAGFTLAQADTLRWAIGKKITEKMNSMKELFTKGALDNHIPEEIAEDLFNKIAHFGEYGFNKSHSAAYGVLSYQTAYLKAHFPIEYMCSLLSSEIGDPDKLQGYINEANEMGIKIEPPDVNKSSSNFTCDEKSIRFGLAAIKNVGSTSVEEILKAKKEGVFISMLDFCERVDQRKVNKKVIESLIKSGAFDSFGKTRRAMFEVIDSIIEIAQRNKDEKLKGQKSLFEFDSAKKSLDLQKIDPVPQIEEWDDKTKLQFEIESVGFFISGHPLDEYMKNIEKMKIQKIMEFNEMVSGEKVKIAGIITSMKEKSLKDKEGKIAFFMIDDKTGQIECIVYPKEYPKWENVKSSREPLIVTGNLLIEGGEENGKEKKRIRIRVEDLLFLEDACKKSIEEVEIIIDIEKYGEKELMELHKIIKSNSGHCAFKIKLILKDIGELTMVPVEKIYVNPTQNFISSIKKLFGGSSVKLI